MLQGQPRSLHGLIERTAASAPGNLAVIAPDGELSYEELWRRAGGLADRLAAIGVGPDTRVGLCAAPSTDLFVGLLGILRAGAAYVPLDPAYPPPRLAQILEAARPAAVAVGPGCAEVASLLESQVRLEIATSVATDREDDDGSSDDPAYVMFTSGSTGRPKGIVVSHRNALWSTLARHQFYAGRDPERFLLLSSIAFDSSVAGIFWTLSAGGTLVVPSRGRLGDPEGLARLAAEHGVTHLLTVPTLYAELVERLDREGPTTVIVAGEECLPVLVERHHRARPGAALFNEYGPTETTVWATAGRLVPGEIVSLGHAVPGAEISIRRADGSVVADGQGGEIWIGGEGVTRGYLDRPELTDELFVPDPDRPTARLYRSGDLGRIGADGRLEFLGRNDDQVQVGGVRVELGEIEEVLLQHDLVGAAIVGFDADQGGPGAIRAQVVPRVGAVPPAPSELRQWVAARLPASMVPAFVEVREALPTLPNGKVDRTALGRQPATPAAARPLTDTEALVADLWRDLLELDADEPLAPDDNFFAFGGHSLMLMRLRHGIEQRTGAALELREMLTDPSIAGFAAGIESVVKTSEPA